MFDFFTHWFAKTYNKGEAAIKSHYKNGHFSLDLTFIVIVLVIVIIVYLFRKYKQYLDKKYNKKYQNIPLNQLELQPMHNPSVKPYVPNHIV